MYGLMRTAGRVLPDRLMFLVMKNLAGINPRMPLKDRDRAALAESKRLTFGPRGRNVAWSWGAGPLIICMHGWAGRGTQMAPLAMHLAASGFQAVVFDVTGHGESGGRRTSFELFTEDVAALTRRLGRDVYAYVGHSAGGMCLMAARATQGIRADNYVLISAPRFPYPPVRTIRKLIGVSDRVLDRCKELFSAQLGSTWHDISQGAAYAYRDQGRLLLIYDHDDPEIHHSDGDKIAAGWPASKLIKTRELGHHRILWAPDVLDNVTAFLQPAQVQGV